MEYYVLTVLWNLFFLPAIERPARPVVPPVHPGLVKVLHASMFQECLVKGGPGSAVGLMRSSPKQISKLCEPSKLLISLALGR